MNIVNKEVCPEKRRRFRKRSIAAVCCICAALVALSGGVAMSRMIASGIGSDGARAAVFAVSVAPSKGNPQNLSIDLNDKNSTEYSFAVTNTKDGKISEVSVKYSVLVTLPKELPDGLTMQVNNQKGTVSQKKDGCVYSFSSDGWNFSAGKEESRELKLTIKADPEKVIEPVKLDNIHIAVRAEQID